MTPKALALAGLLSFLAGTVLAQPLPSPGGAPAPRPHGPDAHSLQLPCTVDPAIQSLTLTKGTALGAVTLSYRIVNAGRQVWRSGLHQQVATLTVRSGGATLFTNTRLLPNRSEPGAIMDAYLSRPLTLGEFGGDVDLMIIYDPDILLDSNRCNDDAVSSNNRLHVSGDTIAAFLRGPSRFLTLHP